MYKKTQVYYTDPAKNSEIKGDEGTRIYIQKNSILTKDGKQVSGIVRFELSEYYSFSDIILSRLSTESERKPIQTKGMIRLHAYLESGDSLEINPDYPIEVRFATRPEKGYELFYGGTRGDGNIDWKAGNKDRTFDAQINNYKDDSLGFYTLVTCAKPKERKGAPFAISSKKQLCSVEKRISLPIYEFGWINCDRFLNFNDLRTIVITENERSLDLIESPYYILLFPEIKSILPAVFDPKQKKYIFQNIPNGEKAILLGFIRMENRKWNYGEKKFIVGAEGIEISKWIQYDALELERRIQSLTF
ncbi:hypothetical protein [Leptospira sarikeiensis]|uniref:Uncharacterized protein n=1 Tax=Leptospira sarikeiensis TaxID=2484943 RepID=A0A4R9KC22_9LEPT|nr:hypothetical protein [Leptospira sarikeiensis]TGL64307.1 hypothetical protein EHQ64_02975 [Leptospira sarikeiensis]